MPFWMHWQQRCRRQQLETLRTGPWTVHYFECICWFLFYIRHLAEKNRGKDFLICPGTFNIVAHPYHLLPNVWKASYIIIASIFVDVPGWTPYSTDKFISCVLPGLSQWFFHFGEDIINAWTQEKTTTLGGTESHHFSWQCKESHSCCHGHLAPLTMGNSGTPTVLTRYEDMRFWCLRQSEITSAMDPVQHKRWTHTC